jgi:pyruvate ferredoxin oxidoreductase alpha subunit
MSVVAFKTGNEAIAEAWRQINPDVVAAYPITPSTTIMQAFTEMVADGEVDTEMVCVESEHSAMSACVGASATGGRVMTATSAQGLALMVEVLYIASGMRLPILLALATRALSAPLNIHGDHHDAMLMRDSGWIEIFSENVQESYDNMLQAARIAEHHDVRLPVAVCLDGMQTSHQLENFVVEDDAVVKDFIGEFDAYHPLVDTENPVTYGACSVSFGEDFYFEAKRQQMEAFNNALRVVQEIGQEFGEKFGRHYGLFEEYRLDDAEFAIVIAGANSGTVKDVVDDLRDEGKKVGLLKIRLFRPWPWQQLRDALKHLKGIAVFDRSSPAGSIGAAFFNEIRSTLYGIENAPIVLNFIYGLGGRQLMPEHIRHAFEQIQLATLTGVNGELIGYLNIRE